MNHSPRNPLPLLSRAAGLVLFMVASHLATAEPASTPPKPYRLFMGSNLSVVSKDLALPVIDVRRRTFVVKGPRGDQFVNPNDRQFQLKIDDALKLSSAFAMVENLNVERIYTPGNDPMDKFVTMTQVSGYMADQADNAMQAQRYSESGVGQASAFAAIEAGSEGEPAALAQLATSQAHLGNAQASADRAQWTTRMQAISPASMSGRLTSDLAAGQFDGVRVTFKLSSPRRLETPYAVIFIRYLEQQDRPNTANVWIHAEKLPDIDESPRTITIQGGGLTPGYHIDSYHVHLYEGTAEIATTVSPKQVALTTDEAFQFSVIQHITANRDQTKDPAEAKAFWPGQLQNRVPADMLSRIFFVKVGPNGRALGLFEDKDCAQPVTNAGLVALIPELRFLPALTKGKPVVGIAPVKLGDPGI